MHAKLSPSSAARWLSCTAAPTMEESFPDESSEYAEEGIQAHLAAELYLKKWTGERKHIGAAVKAMPEAMKAHARAYVDYIGEQLNAMPVGTFVDVERLVDFSEFVPEGFGTCDCLLACDGILHVIDYKYGRGVTVEAKDNPQLMLYALGALLLYRYVWEIETVRMTIFQPRLDHISYHEMKADDLMAWGESIRDKAEEAFYGPGNFAPSEQACRFCKARFRCQARTGKAFELANYEFAKANTLSNEAIADILERLKEFEAWAKDIKDHALEYVKDGGTIPGWKLVQGRSNRQYKDKEAVIERLGKNFYPREQVTELIGITKLEEKIGKDVVNHLLSDLIMKPSGKPTLVPENDKRPAYNEAAEDFKEDTHD